MKRFSILFSTAMLSVASAFAQAPATPVVAFPQPSPKASVMQTVGITDITVEYSSPGVKGRDGKIWGTLIPFDMAWRAGANSPTKVTFSRDVIVGEKTLAAGSYSLFITPSQKGQWMVHFNSKNKSVFDYETAPGNDNINMELMMKDDAVTLKTKVEEVEKMREHLAYSIEFEDDNMASIIMSWEKVRVTIPVNTQTKKMVMDVAEKGLGTQVTQLARQYGNAAQYAMDNNDMTNAKLWIDKSMNIQNNYQNTWMLARYQAASKDTKTAKGTADRALMLLEADKNVSAGARTYWADLIKNGSKDWK